MPIIDGTDQEDQGATALIGSNGDDIINGLAGDDEIDGVFGDDLLNGGPGADTVFGRQGDDSLFGGDGNDSLNGGVDADEIDGGAGHDSLIGEAGPDTLRGGAGNDTLDGTAASGDFRNTNIDIASFSDAPTGVTIVGGSGSFSVDDGFGSTDLLIEIEGLEGSQFDDVLTAAPLSSYTLYGLSGDDQLIGVAANSAVYFFGGDGNDLLDARQIGSKFGVFDPGRGNDTIYAGNGDSFERASLLQYADSARADGAVQGIAVAFSGEFDGVVTDYVGDTDIFEGMSSVQGTDLDDTFTGSIGNQAFRGEAGDDTIDGGAGDDDLVDYQTRLPTGNPGIFVDLEAGEATDITGDTDTLRNIENVNGAWSDDYIAGDGADNFLFGYFGNNTILGRGGNDVLYAFGGNDTFDGGAGNDTIVVLGGDTVLFAPGGGQDRVTSEFRGLIDYDGVTLDLTAFGRGDALQAIANVDYLTLEDPDFRRDDIARFSFMDGSILDCEYLTATLLPDLTVLLKPDNSDPSGMVALQGEARAHSVLTADVSGLFDPDVILAETITYQWQRNGTDIPGATDVNYTVLTEDIGMSLRVTVTYDDWAMTTESVASDAIIPDVARSPVTGGDTPDILNGSAADDIVTAAAGNDTILASGGDDLLDGGPGIDTVQLTGPQSSYTLTLTPTGISLEDRRPDETGTDVLKSIELLDFGTGIFDEPFDLRVFAGPTTLSEAAMETVIELYIAYFNRAPDAVGLNFWGTAFANGRALETIAADFGPQPETQAAYPPGTSNTVFATTVYNNVLGRVPDQDGLDFWVGVLDGGSVGRDTFILEVLRGVKAAPPEGASQAFIDQQMVDAAYLANKTDIGAYFAVIKGMSDVADASAAMALFDGSEASITAAVAAIDTFHTEALDPDTGGFLMPLVGVLDDPFM